MDVLLRSLVSQTCSVVLHGLLLQKAFKSAACTFGDGGGKGEEAKMEGACCSVWDSLARAGGCRTHILAKFHLSSGEQTCFLREAERASGCLTLITGALWLNCSSA